MRSCVFCAHAANYDTTGTKQRNIGWGGSALDLVHAASTAAPTMPLGVKEYGLYFPNVASNSVTIANPDNPAAKEHTVVYTDATTTTVNPSGATLTFAGTDAAFQAKKVARIYSTDGKIDFDFRTRNTSQTSVPNVGTSGGNGAINRSTGANLKMTYRPYGAPRPVLGDGSNDYAYVAHNAKINQNWRTDPMTAGVLMRDHEWTSAASNNRAAISKAAATTNATGAWWAGKAFNVASSARAGIPYPAASAMTFAGLVTADANGALLALAIVTPGNDTLKVNVNGTDSTGQSTSGGAVAADNRNTEELRTFMTTSGGGVWAAEIICAFLASRAMTAAGLLRLRAEAIAFCN